MPKLFFIYYSHESMLSITHNVPRASDVAAGHVPSLSYEGEAEHRRGKAPRSASVCPLLCAVSELQQVQVAEATDGEGVHGMLNKFFNRYIKYFSQSFCCFQAYLSCSVFHVGNMLFGNISKKFP